MPYTVQVQAAVDAIESAGVCYVTCITENVPVENINTAATALAEAWKLLDPGRKSHILVEFINLTSVVTGELIRVRMP
jgi:hypothetical protein